MNWETFYLICFATGFLFSVFSFLGGAFNLHLPKFFHLGHGFGGHGHVGVGHGHGTLGHGHGSVVKHGAGPRAAKGQHFSFFNPMTLAAFLTWFGGTGYLLEHMRHMWVYAGLAISTLAGLAGASLVFWFVAKFLMAHDYSLDPLDFEMVGVLGYVCSSIREGGTGEIIFTQQDIRRVCAARCEESGCFLNKGTEVVVTRYDRGVAYVRPWDELAGTGEALASHERITE